MERDNLQQQTHEVRQGTAFIIKTEESRDVLGLKFISEDGRNLTKSYDTNQCSNKTLIEVKQHRKYKKGLPIRCIHNFKSDLINKIDHMYMWGTKPLSVILSQT